MKSVALTAYPRTLSKRSGVKKVRLAGRVPAVIYGRHNPPQNLEIIRKEIEDLIHHSVSENVLVDLSVTGDANAKRLALVQEVQHHALSGQVLHVDLHEVLDNEKVTIMIPVETVGEALGVKTGGGILEHVLFRIKARALPKDLPEVITVDVVHLDIGQSIHIGDIQAPPGVEILGDKKISVISVAQPITEAQELAEAEAAAVGPTEPEMIKEKKEEGEEAVPAGKAGEKAAVKGAEKGAEKAPAKGAEKAAEKGAEKKPEKKK
ncbi:MAG: 50S ribosomal protein L25 [Chloroflexi bacterium]|nr:50S ribosomal protein L25 [Chloroflexota bacterium]